jgi:hypothetical protein
MPDEIVRRVERQFGHLFAPPARDAAGPSQ